MNAKSLSLTRDGKDWIRAVRILLERPLIITRSDHSLDGMLVRTDPVSPFLQKRSCLLLSHVAWEIHRNDLSESKSENMWQKQLTENWTVFRPTGEQVLQIQ